MKRLRLVAVILLAWLAPQGQMLAQTEPESATKALVFTQTKSGKIDTVRPQTRVEVAARHRFFTVRGNLEAVTDSSIVVRGKSVPLADVKSLFAVRRRFQTIGLVLAFAGLSVLLFAVWAPILAANYLANHPTVPRTGKIDRLANVFAYPAGLILMLLGDVILAMRGRRYLLRRNSKWRMEVREVPAQKSPEK